MSDEKVTSGVVGNVLMLGYSTDELQQERIDIFIPNSYARLYMDEAAMLLLQLQSLLDGIAHMTGQDEDDPFEGMSETIH